MGLTVKFQRLGNLESDSIEEKGQRKFDWKFELISE